jgi:TnpA family transposase
VTRRQRLTDNQIAELFEPPTAQHEMVRHFTLSDADLAAVKRCHGDQNRLGFAVMLCYLRHPGRSLRPGERPPFPLLAFVAEQVGVFPDQIDQYLAIDRNRQHHALKCQEQIGLRPFGRHAVTELLNALLPSAIENDRLANLAALVMQSCRDRKILVPSPIGLEQLCADLRRNARKETYRRLTNGLTIEQRKRLDALTKQRENTSVALLSWLRQMPQATKPSAMNGLIDRLRAVRDIGIEPGRGHLIHQTRLGQLVREAGRTTVQHIADYERYRRHATLVAVTLDTAASLTDHAIDLFDRLVGAMFCKAEARQARTFFADAKAINEKVRLYANVGAALIAARGSEQSAYDAIASVIPWDKFRASVAEAEELARPEAFDVLQSLGDRYLGVRRWSPAFLETFAFEGVPATASLLRAITMLRDMNAQKTATLPKTAPTGFIKPRWNAYVLPGGAIDRRYYELCVLSELRDRLRAGDIWVAGSRQYRSFEERLISPKTLNDLKQSGILPIAADPDFDRFIAGKRALLDERLAAVNANAAANLLPDVTITKGVLKIAPIEKSTPVEAEALATRLYTMLPRIRITDLLTEVAGWTGFTDCFTHLRDGQVASDNRILMAGLLADGLNLGLTRMAEACSIASLGQIAWMADWHIREETYALALRCLVNQQQKEPFAAVFGKGTLSSSDGQFFQTSGFGRDAGRVNAHYGQQPGIKIYTHISDRYAPFYTKLMASTASEALHVLDALLYNQSDVTVRRHHTDGGGESDHVFGLSALLGFEFAPRIPDLKHRRLYCFGKPSDTPALEPMIAGKINVDLIRAHWQDILRVAASIRTGTVTASLIMRQLASFPRQNGVAAALRELGRLERTLFTLDWISDRDMRREGGRELNKGEAKNSLSRAVFIHRLGEIRDRTYENQQHRASGLNLLVTAIILWNTRYLERAVADMREIEEVPEALLQYLSPLGWEHINLTGDYVWATPKATENNVELKPMRVPATLLKAA